MSELDGVNSVEWVWSSAVDRVGWLEFGGVSLDWECIKLDRCEGEFPIPRSSHVPRQHVALLAQNDGRWRCLVGNQASISQGCSMGGTRVIAASDIPCYRKKLKPIWKGFKWKHAKEARPGQITNNQTEIKQATSVIKQATSTQRKQNHTCDTYDVG